MSTLSYNRLVSGMLPTNHLSLSQYQHVVRDWIKRQHQYECFFYFADVLAIPHLRSLGLTSNPVIWDRVIDCLACGVNTGVVSFFIQSRIHEICELHTLFAMNTPLAWLERIPAIKELEENPHEILTYGQLGIPLLQASTQLAMQAEYALVSAEELPNIEMAREVVRRFNHLYGRDEDYQHKAQLAIEKLGKKQTKVYLKCHKRYQEQGDEEALEIASALLEGQHNLNIDDRERLLGYLEGRGKMILQEPEQLIFNSLRISPVHFQAEAVHRKLSLRDSPKVIAAEITVMPTDPARVRRQDPGDPQKCPVWALHEFYSSSQEQNWAEMGCQTAGIGCVDCKQVLIKNMNHLLAPIQNRIKELSADPGMIRGLIADGCDRARDIARATLNEVQEEVGVNHGYG